MPKEGKKRGRRGAEKRKRDDEENANYTELAPRRKRQRSNSATEQPDKVEITTERQEQPQDPYYEAPTQVQVEFYGLLNEDEQTYFKGADQMLDLNQFADAEERNLFLASVWEEAHGKELKIANSQSCSRFLERLIQMSSPKQLKVLFQKLSGHFLSLVTHRFASHCCEALFLQSAPIVTQELIAPSQAKVAPELEGVNVPMEDLFLSTVAELEGNMGYLMTDSFASHVLRVLLVVLSGRPLDDTSLNSILRSKKKEKIEMAGNNLKVSDGARSQRAVPDSFDQTLQRMSASTVGGLDTNYLRALGTHPIGNPVIQLLLELEFAKSGKQKAKDERSLFRTLVPDDPPKEGTQSAAFIKGLLYDPVGSRLLETIIQHAPGKFFKSIYRSLFRDDLQRIVKNEAAGFVTLRVLERLSREDMLHAKDQLCPEVPSLLGRSRHSTVKAIIDRCRARQIDTQDIADAMSSALGASGPQLLPKLLQVSMTKTEDISTEHKAQIDAQNSSKLYASLLAQSMVEAPGPLREMVISSMLAMDAPGLVLIAKDKTATHVVQFSLNCDGQPQSFRRKFLQRFTSHITELATDPVGSHVVDAFWAATDGLHFLRERIAEELLSNELTVKDSFSGRAVWRNWMMDIYKRRKVEWIQKSKASNSQGHSEDRPAGQAPQERKKTAIELARERHAAGRKSGGALSGSNRARVGQTRQTVTAT